MKSQPKRSEFPFKRRIALCLAIFFTIFTIAPSWTLAETITVKGGTIDVNTRDNTTNWNVTGHPVWNVRDFNVDRGSTYNIAGLGSGASLALLVGGGRASNIFGTMNLSNLDFILQNIAGIHIGSTGLINLNNASLIASTLPLNLTATDFLARDYQFSGKGGFLMNEGKITGSNAALVALISGAIANKGVIEAPMGTVALAAGELVTIGLSGDGVVSVGVDKATASKILDADGKPITDQIYNRGRISADGGTIKLNAQSVDDIFHKAINLSGTTVANKVINNNGKIEFVASGDITNTGRLEAKGGSITIDTEGSIENKGTLRTGVLQEHGYTFISSGRLAIQQAHFSNKDGAAQLFGSISGGAYTDGGTDGGSILFVGATTIGGAATFDATDNVQINGAYTITLGGDTTFNADSDKDGDGAFMMNSGSSIVGNSHALTLYTSGQGATLEKITGTSSLTLNGNFGTELGDTIYTMNQSLTVAGLNIGDLTALLLDGHNLSVSGTLSNEGGIALIGSEIVTLTKGNDTDSGVWCYFGDKGGTATTYTIKHFGATVGAKDYFDLLIGDGGGDTDPDTDTDDNDIFGLAYDLVVAGKLSVRDGIFNAGTKKVTVTGLTEIKVIPLAIKGGTYKSGTGLNTFNGGFTISGGTLTGSTGIIDCNGDFTITGSADDDDTGPIINMASIMRLSGNLTQTGYMGQGAAASAAVMEFDGTGTQIIDMVGAEFPNLKHSGTGTLQLAAGTDIVVQKNLTNSAGTLDNNGQDISVGGNWVGIGGSFNPTDGTVYFDGSSTVIQSVTAGTGNAFFNVVHQNNADTGNAGTVKLLDNFIADGTFENSAGIFDASIKTVTVSELATLSGGTYKSGTGLNTFDGGFTISGGTLTGSTGTFDCNGDFTITDADGTPTINAALLMRLSGDLTDTATTEGEGKPYSTATVLELDGTSGTQTIDCGGDAEFPNLKHSGASTLQLGGGQNLFVDGTFTNSGGIFEAPAEMTVGGNMDLTNLTSGNFHHNSGKVIFNGTSTLTSDGEALNDVQIGTTTPAKGGSLKLVDDAIINGGLTVMNGGATTLNLNGKVLQSGGDFNLTNLDTFTATGSTVKFTGDQTVTSASKTYNKIEVTGGTSGGITFADAFSAANFKDVTPSSKLIFTAGKTYNITGVTGALNLNGQATGTRVLLTSDSPGARYTFNLTNQQTVDYVDVQDSNASGKDIIATHSKDSLNNDNTEAAPHWIITTGVARYWMGLVAGGLWTNTANWAATSKGATGSSAPTASDIAIFDIGKTTSPAAISDGYVLDGLYMQTGYTGIIKLDSLTNATFTPSSMLFVGAGTFDATSGSLDANHVAISGGTLKAPSVGTFSVSGNWTKTTGIFTHNSGKVTFDGTTELTSGLALFNEVQIGTDTASGSLKLLDTADFNNELTFNTTGGTTTLDLNGKTLKYSHSSLDLSNLDTLTATGSTFVFDRAVAGTTNLTTDSLAFGNLTKSGLDTLVAVDDLEVEGALTLSKGSFTAPANLYVGGNMNLTGLTTFTHSNGTIIFDGTTSLTSALKALNKVQIGNGAGGTLKLLSNADFNGDLTVAAGGTTTLDIQTFTVNFSGSELDFTNITNLKGGSTCKVVFDGTTNLTSDGKVLNHVTLGTTTVAASVTLIDEAHIDGNFAVANITGTTTFDMTNQTVNFSGTSVNFTNLDTLTSDGSTVKFDAASVIQSLQSAGKSFNNLAHSPTGGTTGTLKLLGNTIVNGAFLNSLGTFDAGGKTMKVFGLATITGGTYKAMAGKQTFDGGLTIDGGTFADAGGMVDIVGNLTIDGGTFNGSTGTGTVTVDGNLDLISGKWNTGHQTVTVTGDLTFTGGTYKSITGTDIDIGGTLTLGGGSIDMTGSSVHVDENFDWTDSEVVKFGTLFELAGDWSRTGGTYLDSLGTTVNTVDFNGTVAQSFSDTGSEYIGFDYLTYSGSNTFSALTDLYIDHTFKISSAGVAVDMQDNILVYSTLIGDVNKIINRG